MKIDCEEINPTERPIYKDDTPHCDDDKYSPDDPCIKKPPVLTEDDLLWIRHAKRTRLVAEQARNWAVLTLTIVSIALCGIFYIMCPEYLFLILLLSAILCPFFHSMNAPLWLAILLLTISGWTFTTGVFSMKWSGVNKNPFTQ